MTAGLGNCTNAEAEDDATGNVFVSSIHLWGVEWMAIANSNRLSHWGTNKIEISLTFEFILHQHHDQSFQDRHHRRQTISRQKKERRNEEREEREGERVTNHLSAAVATEGKLSRYTDYIGKWSIGEWGEKVIQPLKHHNWSQKRGSSSFFVSIFFFTRTRKDEDRLIDQAEQAEQKYERREEKIRSDHSRHTPNQTKRRIEEEYMKGQSTSIEAWHNSCRHRSNFPTLIPDSHVLCCILNGLHISRSVGIGWFGITIRRRIIHPKSI